MDVLSPVLDHDYDLSADTSSDGMEIGDFGYET